MGNIEIDIYKISNVLLQYQNGPVQTEQVRFLVFNHYFECFLFSF